MMMTDRDESYGICSRIDVGNETPGALNETAETQFVAKTMDPLNEVQVERHGRTLC